MTLNTGETIMRARFLIVSILLTAMAWSARAEPAVASHQSCAGCSGVPRSSP